MDVLVIEDALLLKEEQPATTEQAAHDRYLAQFSLD